MDTNLGADDVAVRALACCYPVVKNILADLSCLATAGVASDEDNAAVVDVLKDLTSTCGDGKGVSLLLPPYQLWTSLAPLAQIVGQIGADVVHGGSGERSLVDVAALPGVPVRCWWRPGDYAWGKSWWRGSLLLCWQ